MRLLMAARVNARSTRLAGVFAKLKGQLAAFAAAGANACLLHMDGNRQVLSRMAGGALVAERVWQPVAKEGEQVTFWRNAVAVAHLEGPDAVLLRYERMFAAPVLVDFLATLPSSMRRLLEFPTLPYDGEIGDAVLVAKDAANRDRLSEHVDVALSPSPVAEISGMAVHRFHNRIDLAAPEITLGDGPLLADDGILRLLTVTFLESYKGVDRIIAGLAQDRAVPATLTVVGEGSERPRLIEQVAALGLEDRVIFTGPLSGAALHPHLRAASLGVGSIGMHRKGGMEGSPLKGRLYMACGLPVVTSYRDPLLDETGPVLSIPADDSPVPVARLRAALQARQDGGLTRTAIARKARPALGWDGFARRVLSLAAQPSKPNRSR